MIATNLTPTQQYNWFGQRQDDRDIVQGVAYELTESPRQVDWKPLVQVAARIATANGTNLQAFLSEVTMALLNATGESDPIIATLDNLLGGGNG